MPGTDNAMQTPNSAASPSTKEQADRDGWGWFFVAFFLAAIAVWWWMQRAPEFEEEMSGHELPTFAPPPAPAAAQRVTERPVAESPTDKEPDAAPINDLVSASEPPVEAESVVPAEVQPIIMSASAAPGIEETAPPAADDLARIEGIGPKISSLLQAAGITTFQALAGSRVEDLTAILKQAGLRLAKPETWPEQAALAAAGDWEALAELQGQLKGGRRV